MREIDGKAALPFSSQMGWDVGSWGWERKADLGLLPVALLIQREIRCCKETGPTEATRYSPMVAVSFIPGSQKEGPLVSIA